MCQHIRDLREGADLTHQELATLLHVSQMTYSLYERGALDIPAPALIALARFYKVSVDYLLDLTNDRTQRWKEPAVTAKSTHFFLQPRISDET